MKKIVPLLSIFLCLLGSALYAQTDYLVTKNQDTIYGKVRENFRWFGNKIWVTNETGKQVFKYKDITAYRKKDKRYEIIYYPTRKGKMLTYHCQVFADGKLKFLVETNADYDEQFLIFNEKTYRLTSKYFPQELWDEVMKCDAFKQEYESYHKTSGGTWIWMPKQLNVWYRMVTYYNRHCAD